MNNLKSILRRKQKQFSKMTIVEKRIAIAKDVIARIKLKKFVPTEGIFCEVNYRNIRNYTHKTKAGSEIEVCDIVNSKKKCTVCAKGGLFMSLIGYIDNFTINDFSWSTKSQVNLRNREMQSLSQIFSKKQLSLIETTFENDTYHWNLDLSAEEIEKCRRFYNKFNNESKRLVGICTNIVKNNGTFKP